MKAGRFLRRLTRRSPPSQTPTAVERYLAGGRLPWSEGYAAYRAQLLDRVLRDVEWMQRFRQDEPLPDGYGERLDERVVEYPWVLSRLDEAPNHLLDAGATLIFSYLLDLPLLRSRRIVVYTLAPEKWWSPRPNVSYIYGDLRETILREALFDEIVCISTLEHVGLDNTLVYTGDTRFQEARPQDYTLVLREFRRLLRPGGQLLLTLPFGRYENLGWMQQFDAALVHEVVLAFGGERHEETYFRYLATGWVRARAEECADCVYYDIHRTPDPAPDFAAAARAIVCLRLTKAADPEIPFNTGGNRT